MSYTNFGITLVGLLFSPFLFRLNALRLEPILWDSLLGISTGRSFGALKGLSFLWGYFFM